MQIQPESIDKIKNQEDDMTTLQSERLMMIPFKLDYLKAIVRDRKSFLELIPYKVSEQWPNADYAEILPFILETYEEDPDLENWSWLIIHKEDQCLIGEMGCKGKPVDGSVEIGYGIVPEYREKGYATEMATVFSRWLLHEAGLSVVKADCLKTNIGSIKVLERSGFQKVSEDETLFYWELKK